MVCLSHWSSDWGIIHLTCQNLGYMPAHGTRAPSREAASYVQEASEIGADNYLGTARAKAFDFCISERR
jgi:hypothetical protein